MLETAHGEFSIGIWDYSEVVDVAIHLYGRESSVFEVTAHDVDAYHKEHPLVEGRMTVMAGRSVPALPTAPSEKQSGSPVDSTTTTTRPSWASEGLIEETIAAWQPHSKKELTRDDAVEILKSVGRLFEGMGVN